MKSKLAILSLIGITFITSQIPVSATVIATPAPLISSMNTISGPVGTYVRILGTGFSEESVINFGGVRGAIPNPEFLQSAPPQLGFRIPASVTPNPCPDIAACTYVTITPGTYAISVANGGLMSNEVYFTVTSDQPQPTPVPNTGTIKIAVVDQSTGANLVARVEVRNFDSGDLVQTQETTGGSAIFTLSTNAAYSATAIREGYYQSEKAAFKIGSGVNESVIIFMKPNDVTVPIPPQPKPPVEICPFRYFPVLKQGVRGDEVKKLQEILGVNPTGYYGPLTQSKVKEMEGKYGLPADGVVTEIDRPIFFPCYQIAVTSPQPGENKRAGETLNIRWIIERPVILPQPLGAARGVQESSRDDVAIPQTTAIPSSITPMPTYPGTGSIIAPIPATLSIDLVRFGKLVYHVADATLTSDGSYQWQIPTSIASGQYQVRISLGETPVIFSTQDLEKRIYLPEWRGWLWGESGIFTIVNQTIPPPNSRLREQLTQLLQLVQQMQVLLQSILSSGL